MAREIVSPKSTGGGGYNFEDQVSAWWVLHMLAGQAPLDAELGAPTRIRLQARVDGWLLDDLVADFSFRGGPIRAAVSVKSGDVLRASRLQEEFVRDCWELHLTPGQTGFDAARDRLVLASAELSGQHRRTVNDALERASHHSPTLLEERIRQENWCSQEVRAFIQSFACPADIPGSHPFHARLAGALLKAVRIQDFDFTRADSRSRAAALLMCREQTESRTAEEGLQLWDLLLTLVKELRASAGELTHETLLNRLRGRVRLKHHPDHAPDWERLTKLTQRWMGDTLDTIGGIHLPRENPLETLTQALRSHRAVVLLGNSGTGKSALLKALLNSGAAVGPAYCLHADQVARLDEQALALGPTRPLDALVTTQPAEWALLGLDGLDRLSRPQELESVARVIRALRLREPGFPWRLLLTCQSSTWGELREGLRAQGADLSPAVPITLDRLDENEFQTLEKQLPAIAPLLARTDLQPLTGNAKALDLLASAVSEVGLPDGKEWRGEPSLIEWYWERYLRANGRGLQPPALLEKLASSQADARRFATPLSSLSEGEQKLVPELQRLGVLSEQDGTLRFTHDLHADYARQRHLLSWYRAECIDEIRNRSVNPLWHRAIRLLGLHLLELPPDMGERRVGAWQYLLQQLEDEEPIRSTGVDLLLDALPFATAPGPLLDELFPEVLSDREASLLRRFLVRFLYTASVPHPYFVEATRAAPVETRAQTAAIRRMPNYSLGRPTIEWLARRWEQFHSVVPDQLIQIATTWLVMDDLVKSPLEDRLREALGSMVLRIAEWTQEQGGPQRPGESRAWLYTFAMLVGCWEQQRTTSLIKKLAGRPREGDPSAPERAPESWPEGPQQAPDEDFRQALLNPVGAGWLSTLYPSLAVEIFLAVFIEYPKGQAGGYPFRGGLHPVLFTSPPRPDFAPVRCLLKASPVQGLELVGRLTDFVTSRWREWFASENRNEPLPQLTLCIDGQERTYIGDEDVFRWHLGTSHPEVIASVLMTFEAWLGDQLQRQQVSPDVLKSLLSSSTSVAIIGTLVELGLAIPELLEGPLEPFVENPELYKWAHRRDLALMANPALDHQVLERLHLPQVQQGPWDLLDVVAKLHAKRNWQWPSIERLLRSWRNVPESKRLPILHERLPALLDPKNWRTSESPDGKKLLEFVPPAELLHHEAQVLRDSRRQVESLFSQLSFMRSANYHGIINGTEEVTEEQLGQFLSSARELTNEGDEQDRFEEQCGVAAAAILAHPRYLERHPGWKQLCREWLITACSTLKPSVRDYDPQEIDLSSWSNFCAEAVPVLWSEEPNAPDLRRALAVLVGAQENDTVLRLFRNLARHRARHPADFQRLLHLAVWFSRMLVIANARPPQVDLVRGVDSAFERLLTAFVNRSLPPLPSDWTSIASALPEELTRTPPDSEGLAEPRGVHITYLLTAWSWLYKEADMTTAPDREFLIDSVEKLEQLMLAGLYRTKTEPAAQAPHLYRAPTFTDHGTHLPALGAIYVLHASDSSTRRRLWEPWLRLSAVRHEWTEAFLEALYQLGLRAPAGRLSLRETLTELLDFALDPKAAPASRSAQVVRTLLGCSDEDTLSRWRTQHEPLATALRSHWDRWSERALATPENTQAFLSLLKTPAAKPVRVEALRWLTRVTPPQWLQGKTALHLNVQERLIGLLDLLWDEHRKELKQPGASREAFESLLGALVGLQNRRAIVLSQRLGASQEQPR
jgi:hypothetical protein